MRVGGRWALLVGVGWFLGGAALGCERGSFRAQGALSSVGGALGTWRSTPAGCSRDPFDALPIGESRSVVTFLWEDPAAHESDFVRDRDRFTRDDAPLRLEIAHEGVGWAGSLIMVRAKGGVRLDAGDCTTLRLETEERPASHPEGKPSLRGALTMDCWLNGSHLMGDLQFSGCSF